MEKHLRKKIQIHHEFNRMMCYLGDVPLHKILMFKYIFFSFKLVSW